MPSFDRTGGLRTKGLVDRLVSTIAAVTLSMSSSSEDFLAPAPRQAPGDREAGAQRREALLAVLVLVAVHLDDSLLVLVLVLVPVFRGPAGPLQQPSAPPPPARALLLLVLLAEQQ